MTLGQILPPMSILNNYFKTVPLSSSVKALLKGDPSQDSISQGLCSMQTAFFCLRQEEYPHQQTCKFHPLTL